MAETKFGEGIALNCGFDLGAKQNAEIMSN